MSAAVRILLLALSLLFTGAATAHSSSTAYLLVEPADRDRTAMLEYRLALRDADALLDLDANGDGQLTWGEVEDRSAALTALASEALVLSVNGQRCALTFGAPRLVTDADVSSVALRAPLDCGETAALLNYRLFEGIDPSHRLLLRVGSGAPQLVVPGGEITLAASAPSPAALVRQGVLHILGGADHLLFLLALLLPAVLVRRGGQWAPVPRLRVALVEVAWLATAFTLAHSLTLGLASFGLVQIPTRVIEPLIALTVLLAALNNLWPVVQRRLALLAFVFGLVHGFGFAEVLAPLQLPPLDLAVALVAFNGGVELGQLAAVSVAFALLALMRHWRGYPRWVLGAGSSAVATLAVGWIVERVFDVALFARFVTL